MLEVLCSPLGWAKNKKNIPPEVASMNMKFVVAMFDHHQFWALNSLFEVQHPQKNIIITVSSASKTVVDTVLVNWKRPELTNNELRRQIMSLSFKKTDE